MLISEAQSLMKRGIISSTIHDSYILFLIDLCF